MNPVDNITPAAKALMKKKMSFSGRKAGMAFPSIGIQTPIAPATRMEAIAASLYLRALVLSRPSSSVSHVQSPKAEEGSRRKTQKRENDEGNINDGVEIYLDLYRALLIGDWDAAQGFLNRHPLAMSAQITSEEKTALHVAAKAGRVHIVAELVNLIGCPALASVACRGNYRMAEIMLERNARLIRIEDNEEDISVFNALYNGHLILARYLYLHTPLEILMRENSTMGASNIYEAILYKAWGKN
ncbi:hypothetical protein CFP56_022691 [Quercus suber]|uniref:Uncharacterized protein n=1 Tax=Quercus suber TaxID=58331 RepID=A0AAW0KCH5_QUESU